MKKVVHVITGLGTGGAERALYNLVVGGLQSSFDNQVISLTGNGTYGARLREAGVAVQSLGLQRGAWSPGGFLRLRRAILDASPDVVQGWMYHGNIAAVMALASLRSKVPLIWNVRHSLHVLNDEKRLTRLMIRLHPLLSKWVSRVIYNSAVSRAQHESIGYPSEKGIVIPNGFDLDCWHPNPAARDSVRAMLSIPRDALVVGHVARYHPLKDHSSFLQAMRLVISRKPGVYAVLVGSGVDDENAQLASLATGIPAGQIRLLGERDDVNRVMQAFDVFCLSSTSEAFPNVLGEAMGCGLPCVTTDVGDCREIAGDSGIVVPPSSPSALAEGLLNLLSLSAGERVRCGQTARQHVERHFQIDAVVEKYSECYEYAVGATC